MEVNTVLEDPFWEREKPRKFYDPGRKLIKSIRDYQRLKKSGNLLSIILIKVCVIRYRIWSIITGAEIDLMCKIGGGLSIPHPHGIVIHPDAVIGINCLIFQNVTIAGKVTLGTHIDIGAGAVLLGPLTVNSFARIGANAVVTKNISSYATAIGIPAREL